MKKKILIVEDNNDSREILGLFLTMIGHQAIKAKNSNEAIAFAEAEGPDLIFMDIELPDVDGVKTTAILKQNPKTSHIPVVAITAWMSALWEEKAANVGMVAYLIKPVSPQMLKETIEEHTNGSLTPRRGTTLNRAFCFAVFLGLAVVTQAQADEYYIYQGPNGELVVSNKQPPPGSKIIKQQNLPEAAQAQIPSKPQPNPNVQTEGSPKPSNNK
jgi:two-component system, cell cycle response regulator DivK